MNTSRISLEVNGIPVSVRNGSTVLQACEAVGVEVPRFCYHERLLVAGNCRMCLVEIAGSPKPQASCALPVMPNMKVRTDSPRVKKARESVMEFLLLNHPLDCPICDQGGECDRQDQGRSYGSDRSRRFNAKRGVEDKDIGPLVKMVMTRCIHCTRCIRFASEIAGVADLGTSGRGRDTEVGTYISKARKTELSGNLVDLCPVGALTSKPHEFMARPWEVHRVDSIDTRDAIGSSIRLNLRADKVVRILPREDDEHNQAWLGDKSRYARDGAKIQRVTKAYVKGFVNRHHALSVTQALNMAGDARTNGLDTRRVDRVVGPNVDVQTMEDTRARAHALNAKGLPTTVSSLKRDNASASNRTVDSHSCRSTGRATVGSADRCRLVGRDPRAESPMLNVWLREAFLRDTLRVVSMGNALDLTYPVTNRGRTASGLNDRREGDHDLSAEFAQAQRPIILVGPSIRQREDGEVIRSRRQRFAQRRERDGNVVANWPVLRPFHTSCSTVSKRMAARPSYEARNHEDALDTARVRVGAQATDFVEAGRAMPDPRRYAMRVCLHTHGDSLTEDADVVIPMTVSWETEGHYYNTEGRRRTAHQAVQPPFSWSKETLGIYRPRAMLTRQFLRVRGGALPNVHVPLGDAVRRGALRVVQAPTRTGGWDTPTRPGVHDYYLEGHPMVSMSPTLAKASAELSNEENFAS